MKIGDLVRLKDDSTGRWNIGILIEDMDHPLDYSDESLITVNLDPLEELIENLSINN